MWWKSPLLIVFLLGIVLGDPNSALDQTFSVPNTLGTCAACYLPSAVFTLGNPGSGTTAVAAEAVMTEVTSSRPTPETFSIPSPGSMIAEEMQNITNETLFLSFEEWKKMKQNDTSSKNKTVIEAVVDAESEPCRNQRNDTKRADLSGTESHLNPCKIEMGSGKPNTDCKSPNNSSGVISNPDSNVANDYPCKVSDSNPISVEMDESGSISTSSNQENDAEGKTYKVRFNYASVDCAATIMKTNSQARGASAILIENKDSYLLNQCSVPNKFVVVELCEDILIDTIVMANFEFFSSMFHEVRFSVSAQFPTQEWEVLGDFEATNVRNLQTFRVDNPLIWARYLKIEILSHYGSEFYCPISVLRVHGRTMMDELKHEQQQEKELLKQQELEKQRQELENERREQLLKDQRLIESHLLDLLCAVKTPNTSFECAVQLPHLGLLEFLREYNTSSNSATCDLNQNETSSSSLPASAKSSGDIPIVPTQQPATQASIYKTIMNRLILLESNATLSLLYIEEQSKLLSNAFTRLERRHTEYFEGLVAQFNKTMVGQLIYFRDVYQTVLSEASSLMSTQERQHRQTLELSLSRMILLASELRFQKALTLFNTFIIIVLLVYVMLTRDAAVGREYPLFAKELTRRLRLIGQEDRDGLKDNKAEAKAEAKDVKAKETDIKEEETDFKEYGKKDYRAEIKPEKVEITRPKNPFK